MFIFKLCRMRSRKDDKHEGCRGKLKALVVKQKSFELDGKRGRCFQATNKKTGEKQ